MTSDEHKRTSHNRDVDTEIECQCDYCGEEVEGEKIVTKHGTFCDNHHAKLFRIHYSGLSAKVKRLGLTTGNAVYGDPPHMKDRSSYTVSSEAIPWLGFLIFIALVYFFGPMPVAIVALVLILAAFIAKLGEENTGRKHAE